MARIYRFERPTAYDLMTVTAQLVWEGHLLRLRMAIDTGATHSVLDANRLMILGWQPPSQTDTRVRTAGGIVDGSIVKLSRLESLGKYREQFTLFVYDFLSVGSAEDYDGLLGLDFFENLHYCIDMKENTIQL